MATFVEAAAARDAAWCLLFSIEGIGAVESGSLRHWRFCNRVPTYALAQPWYKPWLASWPDDVSESSELLGGIPSQGTVTFEVTDGDDSADYGGPGALTARMRTEAPAVTFLTAALNGSALTLEVDSATALTNPGVLYIGAEALEVWDITGTTITVTRGELDTLATAHAAGDRVYLYPPSIKNRRIRLHLVPADAASDAQEQLIGTWHLDQASLGTALSTWTFGGRDVLQYLDRLVYRRPDTWRVVDVDAVCGRMTLQRQPAAYPVSQSRWYTDPFWFQTPGGEILQANNTGYSTTDPLTATAAFRINTRGVMGTKVGDLEAGDTLTTVLVADPATGYGSFRFSPGPTPAAGRGAGTWTQTAHFIDLALMLLLGSSYPEDGLELDNRLTSGTDEAQGAWDALPVGVGVGLRVDRVDVESALDVKSRTPGWTFDGFVVDQPISFRKLVGERLLKPTGTYLRVDSLTGRVAFVLPRLPMEGETSTPLGDDDFLRTTDDPPMPDLQVGLDMARMAASVRYELRQADGQPAILVYNNSDFGAAFGQLGMYDLEGQTLEVDATAVRADSAGLAPWLEDLALRRLFRNFRPRFLLGYKTGGVAHYALGCGDLVAVTNSLLPDLANGTLGWVAVLAEVTDRRVRLDQDGARIEWQAVTYGAGHPVGRIPPTAYVESVAGSPPTATVSANRYTSADARNGLPTSDAAAFAVGDKVRLLGADGVPGAEYQTVAGVGTNSIALAGALTGLATGTRLAYAKWADSSAAQRAGWVYFASASALSIAGTQRPWLFGEP